MRGEVCSICAVKFPVRNSVFFGALARSQSPMALEAPFNTITPKFSPALPYLEKIKRPPLSI